MLSIAPGYDPKYLTRQVGRGAENYYLSAVAEHGEPPGVWWGRGAEALGLESGGEIDGAVFEALYEHFLDPRDPSFSDPDVATEDKARLGRRKSRFQSWETILEKSLAGEPEASPERREELRIAAKGQARQAVIHHDVTFSPVKSVTLVHAGLLAAGRRAEAEGNAALAAQYRQAADVVWDGVMAGADASLRYLQEHAGEARTGYHGAKVAGRTTGRWIEGGGWVVGRFRQHTNRDGDPQLHVHQAILNRQQCADGKWRALDGMAIYRARPAAAAHGERVMEEFLTRRLGLEFKARPDGQGREVVGVSPGLIAEFSTRRAQITAELEKRVEAFVAAHGRQPSPRAMFKLAQEVTKETKNPKPKSKDAPSPAEQLRQWEERTTAKEVQELSGVPADTLGKVEPGTPAQELADADLGAVLQAAIADVQRDSATWTRYELTRAINRHLPDYLGGLHPERVEALLEDLTEAALDPAGPAAVRLLNAPDVVDVPADLRRQDGRSVFLAQAAERYTTAGQLDREAALMAAALAPGGPRLTAEQAAAAVGISAEEAKRRTLAGEAVPEAAGPRPYDDQHRVITGILTSGRRTDVLIGAAGTGKSFTVSRLAAAWRQTMRTPALGLTTSQNAAGVLKREGLDEAMNIARWLRAVDEGEASLRPGQLVVVDEASMVTTDHLAQIQALADAAGAKVVWAGDDAQLSAPEAGGSMRRAVDIGGAHRLETVVRFNAQWEREASLLLREGRPEALTAYDQHGRLLDGTGEQMQAAAVEGYLADYLAGHRTLLLAATNEQASELSGRIREELRALGRVGGRETSLRDGNRAAIGDLITARRNTSIEEDPSGRAAAELSAADPDQVPPSEITNRDVLRVGAVGEDGSIIAHLIGDDGTPGARVTLSRDYVRQHVELGYAGTAHSAQGRTVDTAHALPGQGTTREMLYVMMTRGRRSNVAYVGTEAERVADMRPGPEQARERSAELLGQQPPAGPRQDPQLVGDRISILTACLEQQEADQTAQEALVEEGERPRHMAHLGAMWTDQIREELPKAYIRRAREAGVLSPGDAETLRQDDALGTLGRLLRQIEMSGRDAQTIFHEAITERELGSADSLAQVLAWRIGQAAQERGINLDRLEIAEELIGATWAERTPTTGDERTDRFLSELAAQQQLRETELGYDAIQQPPAFLVEQLGEPPAVDDVAARTRWAERAGRVMAYREQYGHVSDTDALGPAPSRTSPEQRAAWWGAHDALGRPDASREIRSASDGELWVMRARYERAAKWAPAYVGPELGKVAREAREREAEAVRLRARAAAVQGRDANAAAALADRAAGQETLAATLRQREAALTEIHEARQAWSKATEAEALMAMRADAELRRREHVDADRLPPLHVDQADAETRTEQERAAARAAEQERRAEAARAAERVLPAGQLVLDLDDPQVRAVDAWSGRAPAAERAQGWHDRPWWTWPEMIRAEEEKHAIDRHRRAWMRGEVADPPPQPEPLTPDQQAIHEAARRQRAEAARFVQEQEAQQQGERVGQARTAQQDQAPQRDRNEGQEQPRQAAEGPAVEREDVPRAAGREVSAGQLTLDVFGSGDRTEEPGSSDLAEAVDKARAAAGIAEVRQAEREQQREQAREAEQCSRADEAERAQVIDVRATERAEAERAALEARETSRGQQAQRSDVEQAREAARLAAASYPHSIQESLRRSGPSRTDSDRPKPTPAPRRRPPEPGRDGPGLGPVSWIS
ncbi:MobF family relaxase [Actinomadura mexicana]|uniref:Conjugative relaxase domain-containing protein, TrwC/TraI family n=1 Tax=Actinomadura mexicana TaxID=134959 RepID=A0A239HJ60_9ACTN|nr:MobF family relaxase [Actinomadura mexicana]SNS81175.1 conjugative relaxase domain-containing protein, TrwC/TraI family [Actinomadura mexicana]